MICEIKWRSNLTFKFGRTNIKIFDFLKCNLLVTFLSLLYGDCKDGMRAGWLGVHSCGGHSPTVVALLQTGNSIQGHCNSLLSESHNLIQREKKLPYDSDFKYFIRNTWIGGLKKIMPWCSSTTLINRIAMVLTSDSVIAVISANLGLQSYPEASKI